MAQNSSAGAQASAASRDDAARAQAWRVPWDGCRAVTTDERINNQQRLATCQRALKQTDDRFTNAETAPRSVEERNLYWTVRSGIVIEIGYVMGLIDGVLSRRVCAAYFDSEAALAKIDYAAWPARSAEDKSKAAAIVKKCRAEFPELK